MAAKDRFTEYGFSSITRRLYSWIELYEKNAFPSKGKMLGFGDFDIKTREECYIKILELGQLLGYDLCIKTETTVMRDGTRKTNDRILISNLDEK